MTPDVRADFRSLNDLVQHVQDMHCPDSEILSAFCKALWHRYDKPIEGINKVNLLCGVAKMMKLCPDCPDFWKNILATLVLRSEHAQETMCTLNVCKSHKAYHTGIKLVGARGFISVFYHRQVGSCNHGNG